VIYGQSPPVSYIRTYRFPACWVHEHAAYVHIVFRADHSESIFQPPTDEPGKEFAAAAHEMGYSDLMRYAVEHEIAHQHVSLAMGREYSWVVWCDAHKDQQAPWTDRWPNRPEDEEYLANRLQQFANLGIEDGYGCLRGIFGSRLEEVAREFVQIARPWLAQL
jgi:hypothetical protein